MRSNWHIRVVGLVSLLWNAGGAYDYLMMKTANAAYLAQFTAAQIAYYESYPFWVNLAWALGVWGAIAGSLLLLMRSRHAVWAFALSLAGLLANTLWGFVLSETPMSAVMNQGAAMKIFTALIYVVAILLLWYATRQARRGLLR